MKTSKALLIALTAGALACSSSGDNGDGSPDSGGDGPTPFGFSAGDTCFDVTGISGVTDGCMINVAGVVGTALPVNYTVATGTLKVGTDGSLGSGDIRNNTGTLTRDGTTSDSMMPTCTWHQTDTSTVTVTADNQFTIAVTEVENMFAAACGAAGTPTGGTCTSSWTWTMKKSTTVTNAPTCK